MGMGLQPGAMIAAFEGRDSVCPFADLRNYAIWVYFNNKQSNKQEKYSLVIVHVVFLYYFWTMIR